MRRATNHRIAVSPTVIGPLMAVVAVIVVLVVRSRAAR